MARMLPKSLARGFKSVERLLLFLAEVVPLFQGKLVILSPFSQDGISGQIPGEGRQTQAMGIAAAHTSPHFIVC